MAYPVRPLTTYSSQRSPAGYAVQPGGYAAPMYGQGGATSVYCAAPAVPTVTAASMTYARMPAPGSPTYGSSVPTPATYTKAPSAASRPMPMSVAQPQAVSLVARSVSAGLNNAACASDARGSPRSAARRPGLPGVMRLSSAPSASGLNVTSRRSLRDPGSPGPPGVRLESTSSLAAPAIRAMSAACDPAIPAQAPVLTTSEQAVAERPAVVMSGKVRLEAASMGKPTDPPVLMIMGHGGTMVQWRPLDRALAEAGFFVMKFDARDAGRSQRFDHVLADPQKYLEADPDFIAPYDLSDMARDTLAVLDHFGLAKAHLFGISSGGVIAQILGIRHPERCLSLTLMMSSSDPNGAIKRGTTKDGGAFLGQLMMLPPPTQGMSPDAFLANRLPVWRAVAADAAYPTPSWETEDRLRTVIMEDYHRDAVDWASTGTLRQTLAINQWERTSLEAHVLNLNTIVAPTLIVHGHVDPIMPVECGRELAAQIPGSRLVEYRGGHNFGGHRRVTRLLEATIIDHLLACSAEPSRVLSS